MKSFLLITSLATLSFSTLHAQSLHQEEECAQAAERQFTHAGFIHDSASLSAHYSPTLGRCYAEFASTKLSDGHFEVFREVVDGTNGTIVGQLTWIHGTILAGTNTTLCRVVMPSGDAVNCHRLYEFEDLVEEQYGIK
jgi:hypothetical protein